MVGLLAVAGATRFAWAALRGWQAPVGEAQNVAVALASGRGFADPYFPGSGPTAHLMPTTPLIAAGAHALLGVHSDGAQIALQLVAIAEMLAGYVLLARLGTLLGIAIPARLAAIAFLCLVPLFLGQETLDFRYWEGNLAVALLYAALCLIVRLDAVAVPLSRRDTWLLAAVLALTFFVSPVLGLAAGASTAMMALRRWTWPERLRTGLLTLILVGGLLAPWVLRNEHTLGRPILLRSNAPLEFIIANNPIELGADHARAFGESMARYHPTNPTGLHRVQRIGEMAYMTQLSQQGSAWAKAHPREMAALALRHARQMLFPDAFQFQIGSGVMAAERAVLFSLVSVLGLCGMAVQLARRRRGYGYLALTIAVTVCAYVPFQPMARYIYLIYGLLVLAAADGLYSVVEMRRGVRPAAPTVSLSSATGRRAPYSPQR